MTTPNESTDQDHSLRRMGSLLAAGLKLIWRADRRTFLVTAAIQVAAAIAAAVVLLVGRMLLNTVLAAADGGPLSGLAVEIPVVLLGTAVAGFAVAAQPALARLLGERSVVYAFRLIFRSSARADLRAFDDAQFFDRLRRARVNTLAPQQIATHLATLAGAAFVLVGVVVALGFVQPLLIPIVLLGFVPLLIATTRSSRELYDFAFGFAPHDRKMMYVDGLFTSREPAAEVRAFRLHDFLRERYDEFSGERVENVRRLTRAEVRRSAVASLASAVVRGAALSLVVVLLLTDRMSVASAAIAAVAVQQLGSRLDGLSASITALHQNVLFLDDLLAFLRLADESSEPAAGADPAAVGPLVEVVADDIHFSYPGAADGVEALAGVSLSLRRGEVVALVGENGSGKTTLAKILSGLYRPTAGTVSWNGVELAAGDLSAVRDRVSVTFQDYQKYQFTFWENIVAGRPEVGRDQQRIDAAARMATADEMVGVLPEGYDTSLSTQWRGGSELSIGQWQRLAIARSFYRDAELLVLDEPTAALDARAEQDLFERMQELAAGRTVLLVSHRFSTVKSADRIIVLDHGRIVEEGDHRTLMDLGGQYRELFMMQAAAYVDQPAEPATT